MAKNRDKLGIKDNTVEKKPGYKYPVSLRPAPIDIPEDDCIKLSEAGRLLGCGKECVRQKTVKGVLGYKRFRDSVWVSRKETLALKTRYDKDRAERNIVTAEPALNEKPAAKKPKASKAA